jgi:uncharacterized repeat protein (TIGR03803 family)
MVMTSPKKILFPALTVAVLATAFAGARVEAQTEQILHNFNGTTGSYPVGGVIADASGNLYGTTLQGGGYGSGTAFKLTPKAGGGYTQKVLHTFGNGKDGTKPNSTMILDTAGNLYGTTSGGGPGGKGTVFELSPQAGGLWSEKIIQGFSQFGGSGEDPIGLTFDTAGNLYGATDAIDGPIYGTVFELTPTNDGSWVQKTLYRFEGKNDGSQPNSALVIDSQANLYGTTASGGANSNGTVFELSKTAGGLWKPKVLYAFGPNQPAESTPSGKLLFDAAGNLYGTTIGGFAGDGTVFELSPTASGPWTATALHTFDGSDGYEPLSGVVADAAGNLYGTTQLGGTFSEGTLFELSPEAGGAWTFTLLHSFNNNGSDGYSPQSNVMVGASGKLYGTTFYGGASNVGTVYEITP